MVGEPNASGYNKSGYPFDGIVVVTTPSTGATVTLTSPLSYFGGAFGAAVAIGGGPQLRFVPDGLPELVVGDNNGANGFALLLFR